MKFMNSILKEEDGFSLIEVSLAVGIMALLTAMAVPTFTGMITQAKAKVSTENVKQCNIDNKIDQLSSAANGTGYTAADCTPATTAP